MSFRISKATERRWAVSATVPGLRASVLIGGDTGATHLEVRLCEARAGDSDAFFFPDDWRQLPR